MLANNNNEWNLNNEYKAMDGKNHVCLLGKDCMSHVGLGLCYQKHNHSWVIISIF